MKSEFIHLHNHSDHSLLDGAQNVHSILERMDDLSMDSVALTELEIYLVQFHFISRLKKTILNLLLVAKFMLQKAVA